MPRVSVILPVYNEDEKNLREAISSLLNQTFKDFELIIINDGSNNNSEQVIQSYNDERIIYLKNEENMGIVPSLNRGLDISRGEYIVRMDSDDISREIRLEVQVKYMDEHPEIIAAGSFANRIPQPLRYEGPTTAHNTRTFTRYITNCIMHPTMIIRNKILKENNIKYDASYIHTEDYDLCNRLLKHGEIVNIPETLLLHRTHPKSITSKNSYIQMKYAVKILMNNIIEDFGEGDADKLKIILDKFMNNQSITLREYLTADAFIYRVVKRLYDIIDPQYHSNIVEVYANLRRCFVYQAVPSEGLLCVILFSKVNKILKLKKLDKFKLLFDVTKKLLMEEEEKKNRATYSDKL